MKRRPGLVLKVDSKFKITERLNIYQAKFKEILLSFLLPSSASVEESEMKLFNLRNMRQERRRSENLKKLEPLGTREPVGDLQRERSQVPEKWIVLI